jgi:hypothetical protein
MRVHPEDPAADRLGFMQLGVSLPLGRPDIAEPEWIIDRNGLPEGIAEGAGRA